MYEKAFPDDTWDFDNIQPKRAKPTVQIFIIYIIFQHKTRVIPIHGCVREQRLLPKDPELNLEAFPSSHDSEKLHEGLNGIKVYLYLRVDVIMISGFHVRSLRRRLAVFIHLITASQSS